MTVPPDSVQSAGSLARGLLAAVVVLGSLLAAAPQAAAYNWIEPRRCPDGAKWPASRMPVDYQVHEAGSDDISDPAELLRAVQGGWKAWEQPCCSGFEANYDGRTPHTALDHRQARGGHVVLSWRRKEWPSQLGAPSLTVAVGSPTVRDCQIVDGTLLFNDRYQRFSTRPDPGELDVQSVVTHEAGHILGMGHSSDPDASMHHKYRGGTEMRSLAGDDVDGVCTLYDFSTETCVCDHDGDCHAGTRCVQATCRDVPCQSDGACEGIRVCDHETGDCRMPDCQADVDCPDTYTCGSQGRCIPGCTVCRSCQSNRDCGPTGSCVDIKGGRCIVPCRQGSCPGNSSCTEVRGASGRLYELCLNPAAGSGRTEDLCPDDYVCKPAEDPGSPGDTGPGNPDAGSDTGVAGSGSCPSLGNACSSRDQSACGADSAGCMLLASGRRTCTCRCQVDADCGPNATCTVLSNGAWCVPEFEQSGGKCDSPSCIENVNADVGFSDTGSAAARRVDPDPSGGCDLSQDGDPVPLPFVVLVVALGIRARSERERGG